MTKKEIASLLLHYKAVKISLDPPFTWTSGIKSPIYCDNRVLISYPEAREKIITGFESLLENSRWNFDAIAGTATAAIPWAAFLAQRLNLPMVYVRPKPKAHGAKKQIEGVLPKGARVLIVEDLLSTGGSALNSAKACEGEADAKVVGVIAIFTYGFPLMEKRFLEANIPYQTLTEFKTLVGELKNISDGEQEAILNFAVDPESWGKNL